MVPPEEDEGRLVFELLYGKGDNPRSTAPEPSLLPQLGWRLCHDSSFDDVLNASLEFSLHPTAVPPWTPLWDATLWGIARREDLTAYPGGLDNVSENYWQVLQTLRRGDRQAAALLVENRIDIGAPYPGLAGAARLAPLLTRDRVVQLFNDHALDPEQLDPESVRSLLAAANAHSIDVPTGWIQSALQGSWEGLFPRTRVAHILPDLPPAIRTPLADDLAAWVSDQDLPPDARALWVSRIAPFVSSADAWRRVQLLDDLPDPWREHTRRLITADWPSEPWADVLRSHPENLRFRNIREPHETTMGAPFDILSRWSHLAEAAVERSAPPPVTAAPDMEPPAPDDRRLQADIEHRKSRQKVFAFVRGESHLIDVSIGRGGQIRANVPVEPAIKEAFDDTDADTIELPVWFHGGGEPQKGSITVPRDPSRNSSAATFAYSAPDSGRALPRIHVMRPGGRKILQSAVLVGDVVADAATATTHRPAFELNVDLVAGNPEEPAEATEGQTIITDGETGLTETDSKLVEFNVAKIQKNFAQLVHAIETAADRQDFDAKAVESLLVEAAKVGQQYRMEFKDQLGELAKADVLQIVSLEKDDVLPLELIYDGPPLRVDSKICPGWRQALRDGHCGGCAGGGPDNDAAPARVCPMRFWSLCKVIERRTADAEGGKFRVQAERSAGRGQLRAIDAAVVAASGRVDAAAVTGLKDFAVNTLSIPSKQAAHWDDWRNIVHTTHPELLVAMPHNALEAGALSSRLMLGEPAGDDGGGAPETALLSGSVTSEYVQPTDDDPGPVVLLLGCDTQFQAGQISGFAGEFRQSGAAVTVATFGKLRADQAPMAAEVLMDLIARPPQGVRSVGEVVRTARRKLLDNNLPMALLLVANGDAEWQLPQTTGGTP